MHERLSDLDELILRCRTEEAREHIAEAVAAYRGGAYRATIVMSWIAVVFDLMDKVRELNIAGEAAAKSILDTFESYQEQIHTGVPQAMKQALEFEREILNKVRTDLALIDAQQLTDLERLREDRHRCAHPSFNRVGEAFRPSAELARLHLRNAITHVLGQPPVQGKAALDGLKTLVASAYFPTDPAKAKAQLAASALAHATPTLIKNFIDALIFGYIDPANPFHEQSQVPTTLSVLIEMHGGVAEPRIAQQFCKILRNANDEQMPIAVGFLAAWPSVWGLIDTVDRERVQQFVNGASFADLEASFPLLTRIAELVPSLKDRLPKLSTEELASLLAEDEIRPLAVENVLTRFFAANSFATAKDVRIKLLYRVLDHLTEDHVRALVVGASENNQIYGENGFGLLLNRLAKLDLMSAEDYVKLLEDAGFKALLDDED